MGIVKKYCNGCGKETYLAGDMEEGKLTVKFKESGEYSMSFDICKACREPFLKKKTTGAAFEYLIKKLRNNIVIKIGRLFG